MPKRRKRSRRKLLESLVSGRPLTVGDARREMRSAGELRYGGALRDLQGQIRASDQQQGNIKGWYGDYQNTVARSTEQARAANAAAQAQVAQLGQSMQGQDAAERQRLAEQEAASAKLRGVEAPPSENQARSLAASQSRQNLSNTFAGKLAAQGATSATHFADIGRIGAGAQASEHLRESSRRRAIGQGITDLEKERGAYEIEYGGKLREGERKYGLERAAFGLDQVEAQQDAADKAAQRRLQRRGQNVTRRGQDISAEQREQDRAQRERLARQKAAAKNDGRKVGGFKRSDYLEARDHVTAEFDTADLRTKRRARREAITVLTTEHGVDGELARYVVKRLSRPRKPGRTRPTTPVTPGKGR